MKNGMSEQQADKFLGTLVGHRSEFKLSTADAQWGIQNPKDAIALFNEAVKNRKVGIKVDINDLPIWKSIDVGTGVKDGKEFISVLGKSEIIVYDWAKDILQTPDFTKSISPESTRLDLCRLTSEEILGEKGKFGTLSEIYNGIVRLGGELAPAEAGPQLRLQYSDQPNGEWLLMAMQPIKDSGDLRIFSIGHSGDGLYLNTSYDDSGSAWNPGTHWVFVRPSRK